ncbi:pentatricopeptide repeat-containing protein At1g11290, chloroplastic-like [Diospyros lotus]|uniref:pentatricopeptide repeat-containing protein At1g11290, chloroplastic-like n=1 Tax=Diospyros lotus TaxID=55363 RepID=UPI00225A3A5A|nr:pentatricopeptide repeat-containing protein At1g11290, chloroplastic-like [Diospyros lotus]
MSGATETAFTSLANVINLLPTGTVLRFHCLNPVLTNNLDLEISSLFHNEVAAPCAFSARLTSPGVCLSSSFDSTPLSLVFCWPSVTCYRVLGTVLFPACSAVSAEVGAATEASLDIARLHVSYYLAYGPQKSQDLTWDAASPSLCRAQSCNVIKIICDHQLRISDDKHTTADIVDHGSSKSQVWGCAKTDEYDVDPIGPSQLGSVLQTLYILRKHISFSAKSALLCMGTHLHSIVVKMGFHLDVYINNALVDMYGKCGVISSTQQMFEEMRERKVATWNTLMSAYVHSRYMENAIHLFLEMLGQMITSSQSSVSTVMAGCAQLQAQELGARNQQSDEAMILVRVMLQFDLKSSYVTYISLLSSFHYPSDLDHCKQVHGRVIREGLEAYMYVTVTLLTAYSECGSSIDDFNRICSIVRIWDLVSWTAAIAGYSELGKVGMLCFSKMRQGGITSDFFTFTSILRAAGIIPALEVEKQIHSLVLKTRCVYNLFVQNGLISMYARCGKIVDVKEVFLSMDKHDLFSWNSLLSGLANHGHGREAVAIFEQVRRTVVKPGLTTFLTVLSACSCVGLLQKGLEYFELMKSDDSLQLKKLEYYACVVDLYGRVGYLNEAEAFINLVELYPNDPRIYVLLANVLANGGYWDKAAGVRKNHGNNRQCSDSNKSAAAAVIALCGLLCFVSSFTDSYKGSDGRTHYGFATRKGIWPSQATQPVELSAYKIRFI